MSKKVIVCVVGTRPEAIKMAPVIIALRQSPDFDVKILATGQHTNMLDQALGFFQLTADENLSIMREKQSLDYITSSVLTGAGNYFDKVCPHAVLVHGDTTTTFASALAAFYRGIPIGHVEAGLRSFNMKLPFPEEMNRVLTDRIIKWGFAPTELSRENLLNEGINETSITVTGNTVIDALFHTIKATSKPICNELKTLPENSSYILVTAHRRESWGKPLEGICKALNKILARHEELWAVIPMHKNPAVREVFKKNLSENNRVILCEPLDYPDFVWAMNNAKFIMSDSGGVQEEASAIKKPLLVLRSVTERPEAVESGSAVLVGLDSDVIYKNAIELLENKEAITLIENKCKGQPFGDGSASLRIRKVLEDFFTD